MDEFEALSLAVGRRGGFVEMSYRLFPETRNSFTPDLLELGFNFKEMRQVSANTELRFQIFPSSLVNPLKKELEDLRNTLRSMDEGPFYYTGAPFLSHGSYARFRLLADATKLSIRAALRNELIDGYETLRRRAKSELKATMETLLPSFGIENTSEILEKKGWFEQVFPSKVALRDDFRLHVRIYNIHPTALQEDSKLFKALQTYTASPKQLTLLGDAGVTVSGE